MVKVGQTFAGNSLYHEDPKESFWASLRDASRDEVMDDVENRESCFAFEHANRSRKLEMDFQFSEEVDDGLENILPQLGRPKDTTEIAGLSMESTQYTPEYVDRKNLAHFSVASREGLRIRRQSDTESTSNSQSSSFPQDDEEMIEGVPENLLLQPVSSFSHPGTIREYLDKSRNLDFPFTYSEDQSTVGSNVCEQKSTTSLWSERTQRRDKAEDDMMPISIHQPQYVQLSHRDFSSAANETREERVEMRNKSSLSGHANGSVIVQTTHGPALLLESQNLGHLKIKTSGSAASQANRKFKRWSDEEDEMLIEAIHFEGTPPYNWKRIARRYFSNTRTGQQCKSRWTKSLQPGLVRGAWQPHEDALIIELRSKGMKWSGIAERLPGRIGEHIRERYVNFLDPSLKRAPWTQQEDDILCQQQRRLGNKWTEISKYLPGRSENSVKNRWHNAKMTQRRRMRKQAAERTRLEQHRTARLHNGDD